MMIAIQTQDGQIARNSKFVSGLSIAKLAWHHTWDCMWDWSPASVLNILLFSMCWWLAHKLLEMLRFFTLLCFDAGRSLSSPACYIGIGWRAERDYGNRFKGCKWLQNSRCNSQDLAYPKQISQERWSPTEKAIVELVHKLVCHGTFLKTSGINALMIMVISLALMWKMLTPWS